MYFLDYAKIFFLKVNFVPVLQSPVLNGEVHTEEAEEMTAGNSLDLEQNSSETNLVNEENGHSHSDENHSRYIFTYSILNRI